MKILRIYILKELVSPFFLSLLVFTFIMVTGNLIQLAELVISKGVDVVTVMKLFLYLIPYLLSFTVPMSMLTAVLLVFGRLSSDNEITAIRASGVNMYIIATPVLVVGLVLSLILFVVNDRVLPYAHFASRKVLKDIGTKNPASYLEAGTFIKTFKKYIIFIYGIEGNRLNKVRIYEPQPEGRPTRTIIANSGEFIVVPDNKILKLILYNGTSDEPNPKDPNKFYKLNFQTYEFPLSFAELEKGELGKKPRDMTIDELKAQIEIQRRSENGKEEVAPLSVELHKKGAISFATLAFIMIGLPLGIKTHRSEKSIGFGLSLAVIIVYYLLLAGASALALREKANAGVAIWSPDVVLAAFGMSLFHKVSKR